MRLFCKLLMEFVICQSIIEKTILGMSKHIQHFKQISLCTACYLAFNETLNLFFYFIGIYLSQMWIRLYWRSDRWFQVLYKHMNKSDILLSKLLSLSIVWINTNLFCNLHCLLEEGGWIWRGRKWQRERRRKMGRFGSWCGSGCDKNVLFLIVCDLFWKPIAITVNLVNVLVYFPRLYSSLTLWITF